MRDSKKLAIETYRFSRVAVADIPLAAKTGMPVVNKLLVDTVG